MTVTNPGPQPSTSTQAIASLILGLIGIVPCCGLLAPIAWYLGNQELKAIQQGRSPASGEGVAKAGMILGILGTIEIGLVLLWFFFMGGMVFLQTMMNR
jgi:uncharacterized membrane protein YjgN (DUF898 family)